MLTGRKILVVEDDYFLAQTLVDLLEDSGATVVGPVGWLEEALSIIEDQKGSIDGAILDVNLHGRPSYKIADALMARNIGFVFTTGYGADAIDNAYRKYPRCQKPFEIDELSTALAGS